MFSIIFSDPFTLKTKEKVFDDGTLHDAVMSEYTLAHSEYKIAYLSESGVVDVDAKFAKFIKPKEGKYIAFVAPKDSDVLRTALIVVAVAYGQAWAAGLEYSAVTTGVISAGIAIGATYLAQAIIPFAKTSAATSDASESNTYSIGGSSNTISDGNVPYLIGTHKFLPPKAMQPISEAQGKDVYLTEVFCLGYGPLNVDDSKILIGDTHYSNYEGVQIQVKDNLNYTAPIDLVSGVTTSEKLSVVFSAANDEAIRTTDTNTEEITVELAWPSLVRYDDQGNRKSTSVSYNVFYRETGSGDAWTTASGSQLDTQSVTFYTSTENRKYLAGYRGRDDNPYYKYVNLVTSFIRFNDGLPSGITNGSKFRIYGSQKNDAVYQVYSISGNTVMVGYTDFVNRYLSTTYGRQVQGETRSVTVIDTGYNSPDLVATDSTATTTYRTHSFPVSKGQYDVRVVRYTGEPSDTRTNNSFTWTQLKSVQKTDANGDPINTFPDDLCYIAIKVKASEQLNGSIQNLSCVASSVCHSFNPDTEDFNDDDQSGNPAWEYFKILTNYASKRPLPFKDVEASDFEEWAELCDEQVLSSDGVLEPRFRVNLYVDYSTTAQELLQKIATIGRASRRRVDYREGVLVDKADKPSVINLSPANIVSMSWNKSFTQRPDAFKVKFADKDADYDTAEILVKRDDSVADEDLIYVEDLDGIGITDSDQVYRFGKFAHSQLALRPETYDVKMGINHLVFLRGDVVTMTHDRIQGVTCFGQVLATSGNVVTVDNPFNISNAQLPLYATFSNPNSDSQSIATFEITNISGNELTFASLPAFDIVDGYYSIGSDTTSITRQYLIKSIKTANELTATVEMVDYASPTVYEAEDEVANYESATVPLVINRYMPPSVPVIDEVITDERSLLINSDGSIQTRAELILNSDAIDENKPQPSQIQVLWRRTENNGLWDKATYDIEQRVYANDLADGVEYDFRVRYLSEFSVASDYASALGVTVEGKTNTPSSVQGFGYEIQEGGILLYWDKNAEKDVREYEIRVGSSWDTGTIVDSIKALEKRIELPLAGSYKYWIKAIDVIGLESDLATELSVVMPAPTSVSGVAFSIIEDGYRVKWNAANDLNFSQFEIREGSLWESATVVDQLKLTSIKFPVRASGTYRYLIKKIDTAGNYSQNATAIDVVITNPVGVTGFSFTQVDDGLELSWQQNTNLWHSEYEIRRGASWATGIKIDRLKANAKKVGVLTSGSYTYRIRSIDLAGNQSSESVFTVSVVAPSQVTGISAETIDNNINLRWAEPNYGFKIDYYKVYKQNTSIVGGIEEIGYTYTTFFTRFESDAGVYKYFIEPIDIAGNVGARGSIEVELDVPPDYILVNDQRLDLSVATIVNGVTYRNALVSADDGDITADSTAYTSDSGLLTSIQYIVDTTKTYGDVQAEYNIDENASSSTITSDNSIVTSDADTIWTIQSLYDSGVRYWNQLAATTSGSLEYVIDYGTVIDSSNVRIQDVWEDLVGTVVKNYTISQSLDGISWTDYSGKSRFMRDFRYVKILIDLTSDGNSLSTLDYIRAKLDLKKKYDGGSGEITDATNGLVVEFNQSFLDVNSITLSAKGDGTSVRYAIYDFDDAGDQSSFTAYILDASGTKITGEFSWAADGF